MIMMNGNESDADDEDIVCEPCGNEMTERISRDKGDKCVKKMLDPKLPTGEEVEDHYRFHIPYRNWCPICVQAKGRDMDPNPSDRDRKVSEYSFDYCFPGDEFGYKLTALVGKERLSKNWMATAVPHKGSSGKFAVDKCLEFMDEMGDRESRIIVKNDQEPAMKFLIDDLVKSREDGRTILEESPVKSSGSNGVVERGVESIEGQVRAIFLGFQERLGKRVDSRQRVVTFIPEYAAYLMNRLEEGKDGKMGYERVKGKKCTVLGLEFGEKLLYKVKPKDKLEKINARWEYGIFVGIRKRSNEVWVAIRDNIIAVRAVRRIPLEKRWCEDCVTWVDRVPWNRYKDAIDADGELPEGVPAEEVRQEEGIGNRPMVIQTKNTAPRDFYIKKEDAEKHGYTRGCGGCSSWFKGLGRQPHTEACRERFRGLMREGAKVKNTEIRKREFEEKEVERKKRKDERKEEKKRKHEEEKNVDEAEPRSTSSSSNQGIKRDREDNGDENEGNIDIGQVEVLIDEWACEIQKLVEEGSDEEDGMMQAWDDVHGGSLPAEEVRKARYEEMDYRQNRGT